jgi:hypothetical protein
MGTPREKYGGNIRVVVVKDGRRYWDTNDLTLTPRAVKAQYSHRQQIEETFWLLKQALGWGAVRAKNNKPSGPICT